MATQLSKKTRTLFFLSNSKAFLLGTLILIIGCYFFIDIPLARSFEYLSPSWRRLISTLTYLIDPKLSYFLWPILFFFVRFMFNHKIRGNRLLLMVVSVPLANLVSEGIKILLGRARPELLFSENLYGFTLFGFSRALQSFPSGHACTIGALCGSLACFYPHGNLLFLALSLIFAFTRVLLTSHFLSDIFAGITIGLLISQGTFLMMKRRGFQLD